MFVRVIAIDGGGVRGIVPCTVLATWEKERDDLVPGSAELFAGTSTGAILAAALALGMNAQAIVELFETSAAKVFSREGLTWPRKALTFKGWALPAYSSDSLREVLGAAFGAATMGDCQSALCIPALDVVTGAPRVFRSPHHPDGKGDANIFVVDAVLASAAAPVLFPSAAVGNSTYVDGALWANNPALVALLDARDMAKATNKVRLLSLGCGKPFWSAKPGYGTSRGLAGWGMPLLALAMSAQSEGVHAAVARLLPKRRYQRIDPALPKSLAALDATSNLAELMMRATQAARVSLSVLDSILKNGA